jgi:trehalose 6-phosphate phosphatase
LSAFDLTQHAILLDVDGTLLDIAPTPHEVHAPASLLTTLERLQKRVGGALALVSGRPLADLDRIFAPLQLAAIGGHGAEMRPSPAVSADLRRASPLDERLRQRFAQLADGATGIVIEDKGYSLALHYRQAIEKAARMHEAVVSICADLPESTVEILPGKAVIEVKHVGFNKGVAVRELMAFPPFAGRTPIFVGDDTTDEAAFAVLPEFGGVGISVGRSIPGVRGLFGAPSDVRLWLERISELDSVVGS